MDSIFIKEKKHDWIKPLVFKGHEIISRDRISELLHSALLIFRWILIVFVLYLSIPFVLHELPATREYSIILLDSVKHSLGSIVEGIIHYIPSLFFIAVVGFLSRSLVRFLKFIFFKIEYGVIKIDGFYPEWASTTFYLVRFIIYIFAFVIVYPHLPGSGSKILEGISVFLGVIVSLGSGSAISNLIAGIMISYMRPFQKGDYIKIGHALGRVIEKGTIVTKIMTFKNEEVSIPNTQVLNSQIYNYSVEAKKGDLILFTDVTISYDVPWTKAYELLFEAAKQCSLVNQSRKPFILQTNLGEKNVTYQLNIYTANADRILDVYSQLHQELQIVFRAAGIEMISPDYLILRKDELAHNSIS